ncbi:MAG TPA: glycerophosphodiester phosphodiesterase [Ktedonobacteraceae bacterium]|jgi:glycerophosphoryl diester phosphodiesterase
MKALQRVAHRGGAGLAPENTLAAFRNALTLPIDAVELDVQMSRDGHALVFHDATMERLTDGQGNMLDLDYEYLRSLNASAHFRGGWPEPQQIPTLREVLELVRNRAQVYLEIKASDRDGVHGRYPNIARAVVNELRALNMHKDVLIISFDWEVLHEVRLLDERLQTSAIVSKDNWTEYDEQSIEKLLTEVGKRGVSAVSFDHTLFSEALLAQVHRRGYKFALWTVNTLEELQRLHTAKVDSLTTDRPDLFASI